MWTRRCPATVHVKTSFQNRLAICFLDRNINDISLTDESQLYLK